MSNPDKWADLASNLGIEKPATESLPPQNTQQPKTAAPAAAGFGAKPAMAKKVASPSPGKSGGGSSNWNQLAGDLGIAPIAPTREPVVSPAAKPSLPARSVAPQPLKVEAIPRDFARLAPAAAVESPPATSGKVPPLPPFDTGVGIDRSLAEDDAELGFRGEPREQRWEAETKLESPTGDEREAREAGEERRRRRRRGGRGRSRGRNRERTTDARETTDRSLEPTSESYPDTDERLDKEAWPAYAEDSSSLAELPEIEVPGVEDEESREFRRRKRRRRGRRGRGERGERRTESSEPSLPGTSAKDKPRAVDKAEDLDEMRDFEEDREHDIGDADDDGHELDRGHRSVPSWSEAIGVLVAANLDARAKNPNGGRQGGGFRGRGRGRGGRNRHDG